MTDTTHALVHGKLNSVNDIIDAVEQEQDHDERFHSCRVLIREVKRLREENQRLGQYHHCLSWCYDKERFGWEIDEEQWEIIGRLLGAFTDHNDNKWGDEEE